MSEERRVHRRFPVLKDFAEPIELTILDPEKGTRHVPGIVTNVSAGGMDLVLMDVIEGRPTFRLSMHLPGINRFEVEGKLVWSRPKGATSIVGIEFTRIDKEHQKQLAHMADAHWDQTNGKKK